MAVSRTRLSVLVALVLVCLLAGCGREYLPTATPQRVPITPEARGDLSVAAQAGWSQAEREAADFIQCAPVHFYFASSALTDSAEAVLRQIAGKLIAFPRLQVRIGGHCDERGSEEYNYALGWRRANAVRDYLVRQGVPASQLEPASYGKANPAVHGGGETIWSQNRRAEFTVSKK